MRASSNLQVQGWTDANHFRDSCRAVNTTRQDSLRLVVGFSAGSLSDNIARIVAGAISAELGRKVEIASRPGHNGATAARDVAAGTPDGNTLFLATLGTHAIAPSLKGGTPYDPLRDFACVALLTKSPMLLACHPGTGVGSIAELIARSKSRAAPLTYATSAVGGAPHLAAAMFEALTGVTMRHVRYDETEQLYRDLEAGRVDLSFNNLISMLPRCRSGALRALGVSSVGRSAVAPEIPTIAESGVPGYEVANWTGVVAPRETPADCVAELSRAMDRAMRSAPIRTTLIAQGIEPCGGTPQACADFMATELARWRSIASRLTV